MDAFARKKGARERERESLDSQLINLEPKTCMDACARKGDRETERDLRQLISLNQKRAWMHARARKGDREREILDSQLINLKPKTCMDAETKSCKRLYNRFTKLKK